jgi:hypothetical protein
MENKKRAAFIKMINSVDDFLNVKEYSSDLIEGEIYFEYPSGVFWSVLKNNKDYNVFLYPEYNGEIDELIMLFDKYQFVQDVKTPKIIKFDDVAIGNETKELYNLAINKEGGLEDLYDKILSF